MVLRELKKNFWLLPLGARALVSLNGFSPREFRLKVTAFFLIAPPRASLIATLRPCNRLHLMAFCHGSHRKRQPK